MEGKSVSREVGRVAGGETDSWQPGEDLSLH